MFIDLSPAYVIALLFFLTGGCYVYILVATRVNFTASTIRRDYLLTSFYLAVFSLSYGLMTIAENDVLVRVFWAIGFYIACVYNTRWLRCFSQMLPFNVKHIKKIAGILTLTTTIITALCIFSNTAVFEMTEYGNRFSYRNSIYFMLALANFSVLIAVVLYLHIKWWRTTKVRRQRVQAALFVYLVIFVGPIGFITDFFIPIFSDIKVTSAAAFVYLAISVPVWIMMRVHQSISVTVPNVSGHIFKSVTLPALVLDYNNIIGIENVAASEFFGRSVIGENIADIIITRDEKPKQSYFDTDHTHEKVTVQTKQGKRTCDLLFTSERDKYGDAIYKSVIIRDISEQEYSDSLLNALNKSTSYLLNSDTESFEEDFYQAVKVLGEALDVKSVSIWKNHTIDVQLCCTKVYEWSEGVILPQRSDHTVSISYGSQNASRGVESVSQADCINAIVQYMSNAEQIQPPSNEALSVLIAPVSLQALFWGYVGFNDYRRDRKFNEAEEAISQSGSLLLAHAYQRNENVRNIQSTSKQLEVALEQARTANKAKTEFLANMSHEIRTPMNSIIGFAELAMDSSVSPKMDEYLESILKNSEWLLQIINNILDISKIESGMMVLDNVMFDINDVFEACRTVILPQADEKGLALSFNAIAPIGKRLYGDSTKLKQVLLNLLSNAVKFTSIGMIEMRTSVKSMEENSARMIFEVVDSGIGMTEEQVAKVFDTFVQAEAGTTRKYGGTGLGLSITKRILEMMGGALDVESTPGVGSKFSFELTFNTVDASKEDILNYKTFSSELNRPIFKGEILLCEDNIMNQQVACEHLERAGLQTFVAENGKVGVEMVKDRLEKRKKQYDLIFMDMHMPVMDGLEATEKILELNVGIPIVAMTASIMHDDAEHYRVSGMSGHVGKPFTSQELWRCLLKYLKPVAFEKSSRRNDRIDDELQQQYIKSFLEDYSNRFVEITDALNTGDVMLAHRLVHNLKSNAGQLRKTALAQIAEEIENSLNDGINKSTPEQLEALDRELTIVLEDLGRTVPELVPPEEDDKPLEEQK